jgi:hypothetical protein
MNSKHSRESSTTLPLLWGALGALLVGAVGGLTSNIWASMAAKRAFTAEIAAAREVIIALRLYAADEGGVTVKHLDDLVRRGVLEDDSLLYKTLPDGTKKARWHYFPFNDSGEGGKPVIVSTETYSGGKRIVATTDTSVELFRDDGLDRFVSELEREKKTGRK